jgi:hypothetical protein
VDRTIQQTGFVAQDVERAEKEAGNDFSSVQKKVDELTITMREITAE